MDDRRWRLAGGGAAQDGYEIEGLDLLRISSSPAERHEIDVLVAEHGVYTTTVPCPGGCGRRVMGWPDTDGNGRVVETAEPCWACLGRRGRLVTNPVA